MSNDFFNLFFNGLVEQMINPPETINRDEVENLVVSTVDTNDCGLETAIIDNIGAHPVERYKSIDDAKLGHKKWVEKVTKIINGEEQNKIMKLGYGEIIPDCEIELKF